MISIEVKKDVEKDFKCMWSSTKRAKVPDTLPHISS